MKQDEFTSMLLKNLLLGRDIEKLLEKTVVKDAIAPLGQDIKQLLGRDIEKSLKEIIRGDNDEDENETVTLKSLKKEIDDIKNVIFEISEKLDIHDEPPNNSESENPKTESDSTPPDEPHGNPDPSKPENPNTDGQASQSKDNPKAPPSASDVPKSPS